MKTQASKKLQFKKNEIIELNDENLLNIKGGTVTSIGSVIISHTGSIVDRPTFTLCDQVAAHLQNR
ncbi:class I lanthipeptide [Pontimicrobium sp. MEBiC01747]